jgi:hypothetical protein
MKAVHMKNIIQFALSATFAIACASSAFAAELPPSQPVAQIVVTAHAQEKKGTPPTLDRSDVILFQGKQRAVVTDLTPLKGDQAKTQLFIYIDDSLRASALGTQIPALKEFVQQLPSSTEAAIGYMRNGGFALTQAFTTDHAKAANTIRLPVSSPGLNGSPYFALSYLAKHWPSQEQTNRRVVLMLTDGVDRYYPTFSTDNPYVQAAEKDSQKAGLLVYSIYMQDAGRYGRSSLGVTLGQSLLGQVSDATGGNAYFEGMNTPVSLTPYLDQFSRALQNQYKLTFVAKDDPGAQSLKLSTELPGVKLTGPRTAYIQR